MASGGGGGGGCYNDGRGRRHSGGFPPLPVPAPPRGHMMGGRDERGRGGDFGNMSQGREGGFNRRDARENFGAFGNGGILEEKPVEFFSDFGGQYQGQGNRRGEIMNKGGRMAEHLEREF